MANIDWSKFFIGVKHDKNSGLFIGVGNMQRDGIIHFDSKSDDKTVEMVNAVSKYLSIKMKHSKDKTKGFFGYDIPNCGKLLLVKPDYEFQVYKRNKLSMTKPLDIF